MTQLKHPRTLSDAELRDALTGTDGTAQASAPNEPDDIGKRTVALRRPTVSPPRSAADAPSTDTPDAKLARHYAALELPFGAPLTLVETRHAALSEKFHPNKFGHDAGKKAAAEELRSRLQSAFDELKRALSKT